MYSQNTSYGGGQELTSTVDMDTVSQVGLRACSDFTSQGTGTSEHACHVAYKNVSPYHFPSPFRPSPQYCFTPICNDSIQVDPLPSETSTSRNSVCDSEVSYYTKFSSNGYNTSSNLNVQMNSKEFYNSSPDSGYSSYCSSPPQVKCLSRLSPEVPSLPVPTIVEQGSGCITNPQANDDQQYRHISHVNPPTLEQSKQKKNIKNVSGKLFGILQTKVERSNSSGKKSTIVVFRLKTKTVILRFS
ncbi:unnamed protein product [Meganyctiphanes norvegica]|uniref:Uncharacterized protein n=1 Tax=Meganyctiphanes norvegica TaxID=48144 RepID=A0AAV2REE3_MEGNR